jgi:hypothetical protein
MTECVIDEVLEYRTADQLMVEALLMTRCNPVRIERTGNQLTYVFGLEQVAPVIELVISNRTNEITVTLEDWWRARLLWQINLRQYGGAR